MMEAERAARLIEQGTIEIAPWPSMRGRTLNESFIILDEAQNTTSEQMKMFLTRLGFGSRAVVTGDITQVDLPTGRVSGLIEVRGVLKNVPGIQFIHFSEEDVVRHELVQRIVRAYEAYQGPPQNRGRNATPMDTLFSDKTLRREPADRLLPPPPKGWRPLAPVRARSCAWNSSDGSCRRPARSFCWPR